MSLLSSILYGYAAYKFFSRGEERQTVSKQVDTTAFDKLIDRTGQHLTTQNEIVHNLDYSGSVDAYMTIYISSIDGEKWNSKYSLTLRNNLNTGITLLGIISDWQISGYKSSFTPYTTSHITIKPGAETEISLVGSHDKKIFSKDERKALRYLFKKRIGENNAQLAKSNIYLIISLGDGRVILRTLESVKTTVTWQRGKMYKPYEKDKVYNEKTDILWDWVKRGQSALPFRV